MTSAMPRFRMLLASLIPLLTPLASGAGDAFLAELDDVPLAPGLAEAPGGLLFDSADGRIVEASASGAVDAKAVRAFYAETLAQLGWRSVGDLQFRRDKETLKIIIDQKSGEPLVVRFTLTPNH